MSRFSADFPGLRTKLSVMALIALGAMSGSARADFINGSFENGFTGWTLEYSTFDDAGGASGYGTFKQWKTTLQSGHSVTSIVHGSMVFGYSNITIPITCGSSAARVNGAGDGDGLGGDASRISQTTILTEDDIGGPSSNPGMTSVVCHWIAVLWWANHQPGQEASFSIEVLHNGILIDSYHANAADAHGDNSWSLDSTKYYKEGDFSSTFAASVGDQVTLRVTATHCALANPVHSGIVFVDCAAIVPVGCLRPVAAFSLPSDTCGGPPLLLDGGASKRETSYSVECLQVDGVGSSTPTVPLNDELKNYSGTVGSLDLTQEFSGLVPGIYRVSLSVANSCTTGVTLEKWTTLNPELEISLNPSGPIALCGPTDFVVTPSGGSGPPYTYSWGRANVSYSEPLPETSNTLHLDPSDPDFLSTIYDVAVTDAGGCSRSTSVEVRAGCSIATSDWGAMGGGVSGMTPSVYAATFDGSLSFGDLVVAGSFSSINGTEVPNVGRFSYDGWHGVGEYSPPEIDGTIFDLCMFNGELYAGGAFEVLADGSKNIARWDGNQWVGVGGGTSGAIFALESHDDGAGTQLYAGGSFAVAGGVSSRGIARWNGSTWSDLNGGDVTGLVRALKSTIINGVPSLVMGGSFTTAGYISATNLAVYKSTDTWESLPFISGEPYCIEVWNDGVEDRLFVGGTVFQGLASKGLNDVMGWTPYGVTGGSAIVRALEPALLCDGPRLVAGGTFGGIGGVSANCIAMFDGSNWAPLDGGVSGSIFSDLSGVFDLACRNRHIYAVGAFLNADGKRASGIAQWSCEPFAVAQMVTNWSPWSIPFIARHSFAWTPDSPFGPTLFGGSTGPGGGSLLLSDLWSVQDFQWTNSAGGGNGPTPRSGAAMTLDSSSGKIILFGGNDGSANDETWSWDGNWTLITAGGPSPRYDSAMAYDPLTHAIVLYGGWDGSSQYSDTWALPDTGFVWMDPVALPKLGAPPASHGHALVYDENRQRAVLILPGETSVWTWEGSYWSELATTGAPDFGRYFAATYDPVDQVILVNGGLPPSQHQTWALSGTSWTLVDDTMPERNSHGIYVDPTEHLLVVVGGKEVDENGVPRYLRFPLDPVSTSTTPSSSKKWELWNYPNPFNPATTIKFRLVSSTKVTLRVFSMSGRVIRTLAAGDELAAGTHNVVWNGRDDTGARVASGVYPYRLEAGEKTMTGRAVLAK